MLTTLREISLSISKDLKSNKENMAVLFHLLMNELKNYVHVLLNLYTFIE